MLTLHEHDISAIIRDRYANIVYLFLFENTNQSGSNQLNFEITIDADAFISGFEAKIDDQLFVGITKDKNTASKEYSEAKAKNENAILISQPYDNIPNVFKITTNIDAKSKILLTLKIEQYLQKTFNFNQLNVQILRNFSKYNIKQNFNFISFKLDIMDQSGIYNINIPSSSLVEMRNLNTSPLLEVRNNEKNDVIITDQNMDKDDTKCIINGKITDKSSINELILKYKIKGEQNDSHILYNNKSNTFCHIISDIITNSMIADDEKDVNEGNNKVIKADILIPRRVVFVIDRSQSMQSKWDETINSTIITLKQLRESYDRYCVILFDHDIELLPSQRIILANKKNIIDAVKCLQDKQVGGATNINDTLLKAIKMIKDDIELLNAGDDCNFFMNQIIFITDGQPNRGICDTKQIIRNIKTANNLRSIDKYSNKISIFSFGVGSSGNDSSWIHDLSHSFLKLLSLNNNAFYKRIKQLSAGYELKRYFDILSKPVLSNVKIRYKNKNIKNLTATSFDTLYAGNDLIICGQIDGMDENQEYNLDVTISAITGKHTVENNKLIMKPVNIYKEMKINMNSKNITNNNIDRIWAYLKLQQLSNKKLIHKDMIESDDDEKKGDESLPLSLALKYKFVTPWTSMIVAVKHKNQQKGNKNDDNKEQENNLSSSFETDEDFGWKSYFITLKGNELFCQIDDEYFHDKFNLHGMQEQVPYYEYALDLVCDVENEERHELDDEHQEMIENDAETLYGLSHALYILTNPGLNAMKEKYIHHEFGVCPRYLCNSQPLLPVGISDKKDISSVKLYCPRCEEIYEPNNKRWENIDGACFGTTFAHLFFMVFPELKPLKSNDQYTPKVFGFKLHDTWHAKSIQAVQQKENNKKEKPNINKANDNNF